jgi:hypothetical protein
MERLENIPLDFSQWRLYKTVEPFVMLGTNVRGLTQRCYEREFDGQLISAGVFEANGKKTHVAWGIKSDAHCSYHALAQADGWGTTVVGCPEYTLLRHNGNLKGFAIDGVMVALGSMGSHWDTTKDKLRVYAPLLIFFAIVFVWAVWRNPLPTAGSAVAAEHTELIGISVHYFHDWMYDFMGGFFLLFGMLKVVNLRKFAPMFATYDLVAQYFKPWGYVYPFVEVGLGVLYTLRIFLVPTYIVTIVLMHITSAGIFLKLRNNGKTTCACLGGFFNVPLSVITLIEDMVMAWMAILMLCAQILR